jgi:hypothetical protein
VISRVAGAVDHQGSVGAAILSVPEHLDVALRAARHCLWLGASTKIGTENIEKQTRLQQRVELADLRGAPRCKAFRARADVGAAPFLGQSKVDRLSR